MASVHNLFRAPKKHLPMEELREAQILADFGLNGCSHAQSGGTRQVLLVDRETLEAVELQPGMLRESITSDGLNVNSLGTGRAAARHWRSAPGSHHGVHPLQSDGANTAGPAQGTLGSPRNVMSRTRRGHHPPWRFD